MEHDKKKIIDEINVIKKVIILKFNEKFSFSVLCLYMWWKCYQEEIAFGLQHLFHFHQM